MKCRLGLLSGYHEENFVTYRHPCLEQRCPTDFRHRNIPHIPDVLSMQIVAQEYRLKIRRLCCVITIKGVRVPLPNVMDTSV